MRHFGSACVVFLAVVLSGCMAAGGGGAHLPSAPASSFARDAQKAMALLNAYRSSQGRRSVILDPTLTGVAQRLAAACSAAGACDHNTGGSFQQRMTAAGYPPSYGAENIRDNETTVDGAFAWWKGSPVHNGNMLMSQVTRMGFARSPASGKSFWVLVVASEP